MGADVPVHGLTATVVWRMIWCQNTNSIIEIQRGKCTLRSANVKEENASICCAGREDMFLARRPCNTVNCAIMAWKRM